MLSPDLTHLGAVALYLVVFAIVFVESGLLVGVMLPGDSVLFTAGLLAARLHTPSALPLLVVTVFAAATLGDSLGYGLGRRLGHPYLVRRSHGRRWLSRAERFYEGHGGFAVVTARWFPWLRTIIPMLAGIGRMPYPRFLAANVLGATLWAVGLAILGYISNSAPWAYQLSLAAMGVTISIVVCYTLAQWLRRTRPEQCVVGHQVRGQGSESDHGATG